MEAAIEWLGREQQRQCDVVMLTLGPLYNDEHHHWSVENLAQKAAADITSGTKRDASIDPGTVGAMARIIELAGAEKRRADAAEANYQYWRTRSTNVEARASSWWEAAKTWCEAATGHNKRADEFREQREDQKRRADAAEAELAETNRLLTDYQRDVVAWKRERDEARSKLDEIRAVVDMPAQKLASHWTNWTELAEQADAERSRRIREIVERTTTEAGR
ncbi:hypothetical protein [Amycolatopsis sp. NPDC051372]|uniref:hypothetical protein n=1 Tax=Amycolatopsis sp. NPDC051372 TaxID=3155669 RepID=UPI00342EE376